MKVDRSKFKACAAVKELAVPVREFLQNAKSLPEEEFVAQLKELLPWKVPKIELVGWADVLDRCDDLLAAGVGAADTREGDERWLLPVDTFDSPLRDKLAVVLAFMNELFENTTSRTCFASIERLIELLNSSRMEVVRWVLAVLQTIARRTQLMGKLGKESKSLVSEALIDLAARWERPNLRIADWATTEVLPPGATDLRFDFVDEPLPSTSTPPCQRTIRVGEVHKRGKTAGELMGTVLAKAGRRSALSERRLLAQLRLLCSLHTPTLRRTSLIARLQSIQILLYSNNTVTADRKVNELLHEGLVEELVDVLRLETTEPHLIELKCEVFRTLTAVIHYDRTNRLEAIVDLTNANSYHGFLPTLVRWTMGFIMGEEEKEGGESGGMTRNLATAVLSFIYHLSNYEAGREALVASGLVESLLGMVAWSDCPQSHMQYVTRSVRLIDIMLHSIDVSTFTSLNGFATILNRLTLEVDACREEEPYMLGPLESPAQIPPLLSDDATPNSTSETTNGEVMEVEDGTAPSFSAPSPKKGLHIHPRRSALVKSLQNFIKRVIVTPDMGELTRTLMGGNMPRTLGHVVSNVDYYGPALFLQSVEIVQQFVQQEPGQLSQLQDRGLMSIVKKSLLEREIPATRDVLLKLPAIFQSLCLNERGLRACQDAGLFDRLFKVFLSPKHLGSLKRTRRSDMIHPYSGDTVADFGNAVDELVKHHNQLRPDAIKALVAVLQSLHEMATSPKYKAVAKVERKDGSEEGASKIVSSVESSDSEGELTGEPDGPDAPSRPSPDSPSKKSAVPLPDFLSNVAKFTDTFFFSNIGHHHVQPARKLQEFVEKGGGEALIRLLLARNLPPQMGTSSNCLSPLLRLIQNLLTQPQGCKHIQSLVDQMGKEVLDPLLALLRPSPEVDNTGSLLIDRPDILTHLFHLHNHLHVIHKLLTSQQTAPNIRRDLCQPWIKAPTILNSLVSAYEHLNKEVGVLTKAETELMTGVSTAETRTPLLCRLRQLREEEAGPGPEGEPMDTSGPSGEDPPPPLPTLGLPETLRTQMAGLHRTSRLVSDVLSGLGRLSHPRGGGGGVLGRHHHQRLINARVPPEASEVAVGLWKSLVPALQSTQFETVASLLDLVKTLLFDDQRKVAPSMLRAFYESGAHAVLFQCLERVCNTLSDNPSPESAEFLLEKALFLVEKLTSPDTVLENQKNNSSPPIPAPNAKGFCPLRYLTAAQADARTVLGALWRGVEGVESVDVVRKVVELETSLLRSAPLLADAERAEGGAVDPAAAAAAREAERRQMEELVDQGALTALQVYFPPFTGERRVGQLIPPLQPLPVKLSVIRWKSLWTRVL